MESINKFNFIAHWFLRAALASVFIYHGVTKFPVLEGMAGMMGLPVAVVFLVALVETFAGILIIAGGFSYDWMTRLAALSLVPVLFGAIFMVHWGAWNNFTHSKALPMGGMEFPVTLLFISLYFVFKGNDGSTQISALKNEQ